MMDLFDELAGGGRRRNEYEDFVRRYDNGPPWEGISDDEVFSRYDEIGSRLPDNDYEEAAQEAFSRLSPQERREFIRHVRSRGRERNMRFPDFDDDRMDDEYMDPSRLARMTSRMRSQNPNILGQLLGGGGGGSPLGNPLATAVLGGITAMAAKKMLRR